jgi:hypothetical protein
MVDAGVCASTRYELHAVTTEEPHVSMHRALMDTDDGGVAFPALMAALLYINNAGSTQARCSPRQAGPPTRR